SSCSNDDYTKALPTASTALMYVDADKSSGVGSDDLLQRLLRTETAGLVAVVIANLGVMMETFDHIK
ncbi:MAG: hypothetical protein IKT22_05665, partial [Prevotella sp.]|nr:hypothetical protein [Prevotella sp.]